MRTYGNDIYKLNQRQIFVFGCNTEGRHGMGAAKTALRFGAVYGKTGLQGQTYGIVTKDLKKLKHPSIPRHHIEFQIGSMYILASSLMPHNDFLVAYHGKRRNLNGYTSLEMATMFKAAGPIPDNIIFQVDFAHLIESI